MTAATGPAHGGGDFYTRAIVCVLAVAIIGDCIRSFVGLGRESFILDELFTAWVVGPGGNASAMVGRALADTHPPFFYSLLFGYAELVGRSEAALRSFSAICGVATMLLFFLGLRRWFSVPALLFAMTIASGSEYWLYQTQNARSYALLFLLVTGLLTTSLALFSADADGDSRRARRYFAGLVMLGLITGFTHYYGMLAAIAVFAMVFIGLPRWRWPAAISALALIGVLFGYVALVMKPATEFATIGSWIGNTPGWYVQQLGKAQSRPLWDAARLALAGLAIVAIVRGFRAGGWQRFRNNPWKFDPRSITICVPVLLVLAGIASSQIVAPNFTVRNALIALPFAWGAAALLFDLAIGGGVGRGIGRDNARWLMPVMALLAASALFEMWQPQPLTKTGFRQAAQWLSQDSGCAGHVVPVFVDASLFSTPALAARQADADYGYYLDGRVGVRAVAVTDAMAGRNMPVATCRVVGWGAHYVNPDNVQTVASGLAVAYGQSLTMLEFGGQTKAYVFVLPDRG